MKHKVAIIIIAVFVSFAQLISPITVKAQSFNDGAYGGGIYSGSTTVPTEPVPQPGESNTGTSSPKTAQSSSSDSGQDTAEATSPPTSTPTQVTPNHPTSKPGNTSTSTPPRDDQAIADIPAATNTMIMMLISLGAIILALAILLWIKKRRRQ